MLYLLDANVLIDANRDYYPIERVPEFWEWLENAGENGNVKIPLEVYEEISDGQDELANWAKRDQIKTALLFQEEVDVSLVSYVTDQGYASDLTDDEVVSWSVPFLLTCHYSLLVALIKPHSSKGLTQGFPALKVDSTHSIQFIGDHRSTKIPVPRKFTDSTLS
ncbi:unnamed protein product [marine sediment metagenome]|uniref:PIN domain-containing protein n=1 Tax=marine sediment metagenome TaxID=412755 RepID=X0ZMC6_9ZZZZ